MRGALTFLGFVLFGAGQIWYVLYGTQAAGGTLTDGFLSAMTGIGALVAAGGVVQHGLGRGRGLLVAGLSLMVLNGLNNLASPGEGVWLLGGLNAGIGYTGLAAFGILWGASEKREAVAVTGLRASALVAGLGGLGYIVAQYLASGTLFGWAFGNALVFVGGVLVAIGFRPALQAPAAETPAPARA